jgi:iron-sulfur cluster assembly accessory protein
MFEVSDKASEIIKGFLTGKEGPQAIRIVMNEGGCCGGPSLGMALDEAADSDETFTEKGLTFLVNKELFDEVKPISIEFVESHMGAGFMVRSALSDKEGGCESSSCGSGSCSC